VGRRGVAASAAKPLATSQTSYDRARVVNTAVAKQKGSVSPVLQS